jgi:hypothetical protein
MIATGHTRDERRIFIVRVRGDVQDGSGRLEPLENMPKACGAQVVRRANLCPRWREQSPDTGDKHQQRWDHASRAT